MVTKSDSLLRELGPALELVIITIMLIIDTDVILSFYEIGSSVESLFGLKVTLAEVD